MLRGTRTWNRQLLAGVLAVWMLLCAIPQPILAAAGDAFSAAAVDDGDAVSDEFANTPETSDIDLFVFAGQSNMMGASVLEPKADTFTDKSLEYKYVPKLRGEATGSFVPAQNPAGEFYYKDLAAAYGDKLNDLSYKSTLSNYSANTHFCPAMRNGEEGFSAQSEATTYPSASLAPYFVTEYAEYGHASVYAHMAKGAVKIVHYFTEEMATRYNTLITEYNSKNGKSYGTLSTNSLSGAGDAFDNKYNAMVEDYAAFAPDNTVKNKCFVWLQGEGDGGSSVEYKLKLQVLWEHLQGLGFTHFFVLRVGYWGSAGILNIIKAQEDFCAENDNCYIVTRAPSLIPYPTATTDNWWINEPSAEYNNCRDSYLVNSSNNHFNEKAMQLFAERSAANVHRVLHQGLEPVLEEENIQGMIDEEPDVNMPEDAAPYTSYIGTGVFHKGLSVSNKSGIWMECASGSAASTDLIPVKSADSVWLQYVFFLNEAHAVGGFYDKEGVLVAPLYYKDFGFSLGGGSGEAAFRTPKETNRISIAAIEAATGKEIAFVRFTAWRASAGGHASTEARIYHSYSAVATAPTCTEQGYTTHTCACGDSCVDSYVPATGHIYENGICTKCGEKDWASDGDGILDILVIGNSFSWDAVDFWYDMQESMTYNAMKSMLADPYDVHLAVMYKGSATLGYHATCAMNNTASYTYTEIGPDTGYQWTPASGKNSTNSILAHLEEREWDIIVIQSYQHEADGTEPRSTYTGGDARFVKPEASVGYLLDYFAEHEPNAKVYYYMPWASTKFYGNDTAAGYLSIAEYTKNCVPHLTGTNSGKQFAGIIPIGTGIQNARTTYFDELRFSSGAGSTALLQDPQNGLQYDNQHLSFGLGRYIAGIVMAETLIPQAMRADSYTLPSIKDSPAVGVLPQEYSTISRMAAENAIAYPYQVTALAGYETDLANRICEAIETGNYATKEIVDESILLEHIQALVNSYLEDAGAATAEIVLHNFVLTNGKIKELNASVALRVGYTKRTAQINVVDGQSHRFGDWIHKTIPTANAVGIDSRTCTVCGFTQSAEVEGSWQKYNLADHLQELPEEFCCETNLWSVLKPEALMINHLGQWVSAGATVYSVTIPVAPGDKIYANSFDQSGTRKGIQVSFIGDYGIVKTTFSNDTYKEFCENGGYLIAPEGAIAVNIPVWNINADNNIINILNAEHIYDVKIIPPSCTEQGYTTHTCACADSYVDSYVPATGHKFSIYTADGNATYEADGTKTALCDHGCGAKDTVADVGSMLFPEQVTSSVYTISDGILYNVPAGTSVSVLLSGLDWGKYCTVFDTNGNAVDASAKVATGMVVKLLRGAEVKQILTIAVRGDTSGDGAVTLTDFVQIKAHLLQKQTLTGAAVKAADYSADGSVTVTDFMQVKALLLQAAA